LAEEDKCTDFALLAFMLRSILTAFCLVAILLGGTLTDFKPQNCVVVEGEDHEVFCLHWTDDGRVLWERVRTKFMFLLIDFDLLKLGGVYSISNYPISTITWSPPEIFLAKPFTVMDAKRDIYSLTLFLVSKLCGEEIFQLFLTIKPPPSFTDALSEMEHVSQDERIWNVIYRYIILSYDSKNIFLQKMEEKYEFPRNTFLNMEPNDTRIFEDHVLEFSLFIGSKMEAVRENPLVDLDVIMLNLGPDPDSRMEPLKFGKHVNWSKC
jgi:serine/threonine protein kinase